MQMKAWVKTYIFVILSVNIVIALVRLGVPDAKGLYATGGESWLGISTQDCSRYSQVKDDGELRLLISRGYPAAEASASGFLGGGTLGGPSSSGGGTDYSRTNVQVDGVDEQDVVKTDGAYIYTVSGNAVVLLRAYPTAEARVVARIQLASTPVGLFVDGDRLVVISSNHGSYAGYEYRYYYDNGDSARVEVGIYNIEDRAQPFVVRNATIDGELVGARMILDHVYIITSYYAHIGTGNRIYLPTTWFGTAPSVLPPTRIGWFSGDYGSGALTSVLAMELRGDGSSTTAFMAGGYGTLYVSNENIYFATVSYHYVQRLFWTEDYQRTVIHKISFEALDVDYVCSGEVPGRILNQFSMDEYQGNLRVATTDGFVGFNDRTSSNNVYVLDPCLAPIGKLEGIAPGERIYSSRFLGGRGYLVTFRQVDPFFVIDLSNPKAPGILGYLKIPGFSEYLHPYDENHVIGLGKGPIEGGGWLQGVKLSLFDVTDVEHPVEESKYVIGETGSDSDALQDHKAFMFDAKRGIIAIPVDVYESGEGGESDWARNHLWQGAYVFSVSVDGGFALKGRVTHYAPGQHGDYYGHSALDVRRALHIDDVLYTISDLMVRMNNMEDMSDLGKVDL